MFRFLKNLFSIHQRPNKNNQAFLRSVHYHMVDRRNYQRITYPTVGAIGSVPSVQCEGLFLDPINISLGGILLQNPSFKKNKPGAQFNFKFSWNGKYPDINQKAVLLRVSKNSWHFRFTETDRRYFAEFPRIFKSGIRGATIIEFKQNQIPPGEHIVELWMSEQGDYVIFQKSPSDTTESITLHLDGVKYRFVPGKGVFLGVKNAEGAIQYEKAVPSGTIDELLIFLVNFRQPSHRIRRTISDLVDGYYRNKNKDVRSA